MDYSLLDIDSCTNMFRHELPELLECVETFKVFDVCDMMTMIGYERPWKDLASSIEDTATWLKEYTGKNDDSSIALCPAGGYAAEFVDLLKAQGINVHGFLDSYKSNEHSTYMGLPLYPLNKASVQLFGKVVIVSPAYSDELYDAVIRYCGGRSRDVFVPFVGGLIDKEFCGTHISSINEICRNNKGRTVVYAVDRLYLHNINRVKALSENGMKVILLTSEDLIHHSLALDSVSDIFEYICCTRHRKMDLLYVLGRIYPDIVHMIPVARHYEISVLMHAVSKAPVVCEFYDILFSMHTQQNLAQVIGQHEAEIQFSCERYLCRWSDGIVYKSSDKECDRLLEHYDALKPKLQFQNYMTLKNSRISMPYEKGRKIRIVYAGGVHVSGLQKDHGQSMLQCIPHITRQNMEFDIYNASDMGDETFDAFRREAERSPGFNYHLPRNNSEILSILSGYDFGWQMIDAKSSVNSEQHYATAMNSKFFDYIFAGIPTIISEEFRLMASIVRDNGLGIVIGFEDVGHLSEIIESYDVNELKENVVLFQRQVSMEEHIHRLIGFYDQLKAQACKEIFSCRIHTRLTAIS